jgi:hypothetical protein
MTIALDHYNYQVCSSLVEPPIYTVDKVLKSSNVVFRHRSQSHTTVVETDM